MVDTTNTAPLAAQLQATLNIIPAHTWYAAPSGALLFVNERSADYLGLPSDHPIRSGIDSGADWDDTKQYLDKAPLDDDARAKVFERNARRVYPRLNARLDA